MRIEQKEPRTSKLGCAAAAFTFLPPELALPLLPAVRLLCITIGALVIVRLIGRSFLLTILGVKAGDSPPGFWRDRVLLRYEKLRTSIWMFAWFKVRLDPMFGELPHLLEGIAPPRMILDLGCGHGIAGCALLEWFPDATIFGIDPSAARVRAAASAFAPRGTALQGNAPDIPTPRLPNHFDAAVLLDVIHFLTDEQLCLTLARIRERMADGGLLLIRVAVPVETGRTFLGKLEHIQRVSTRSYARYRSAAAIGQFIADAGFELPRTQPSGRGGELFWFLANVRQSDGLALPKEAIREGISRE